MQSDFLRNHYPEIEENQDHIMDIISLEEKRYAKTVSKGRNLVKKSIKEIKKKNKKEIPLDMLISLYDSNGIPPETIKEIADEQNFGVDLPDNFYTLVADMHEQEEVEEVIGLDASEAPLVSAKEGRNIKNEHLFLTIEKNYDYFVENGKFQEWKEVLLELFIKRIGAMLIKNERDNIIRHANKTLDYIDFPFSYQDMATKEV